MRYKNTRNGAILDSKAAINGEDWVEIPFVPPVKKKQPVQESEPAPEDTPKKKTRRRKVAK